MTNFLSQISNTSVDTSDVDYKTPYERPLFETKIAGDLPNRKGEYQYFRFMIINENIENSPLGRKVLDTQNLKLIYEIDQFNLAAKMAGFESLTGLDQKVCSAFTRATLEKIFNLGADDVASIRNPRMLETLITRLKAAKFDLYMYLLPQLISKKDVETIIRSRLIYASLLPLEEAKKATDEYIKKLNVTKRAIDKALLESQGTVFMRSLQDAQEYLMKEQTPDELKLHGVNPASVEGK